MKMCVINEDVCGTSRAHLLVSRCRTTKMEMGRAGAPPAVGGGARMAARRLRCAEAARRSRCAEAARRWKP